MAAACADDERCLGASFYHPWTAEGAVAVLFCSGSLGFWPVQVKLVLLFHVWHECQGGVGHSVWNSSASLVLLHSPGALLITLESPGKKAPPPALQRCCRPPAEPANQSVRQPAVGSGGHLLSLIQPNSLRVGRERLSLYRLIGFPQLWCL